MKKNNQMIDEKVTKVLIQEYKQNFFYAKI